MATTWNPSDITTGMTLSGGNLTATRVSGADAQVRSTTSKSAGKFYFEFTFGTTTSGGSSGLGIASGDANHTFNGLATGPFVGQDTASIAWYGDGNTWFNNAPTALGTGSAFVTGDICAIAVDFTAKLLWVNDITQASGWLGGASPNPATGSGGVSLASLTGSPWFICCDGENAYNVTLNTGNSAFSLGPPSGFSAWDSLAPAFVPGVPFAAQFWIPVDF